MPRKRTTKRKPRRTNSAHYATYAHLCPPMPPMPLMLSSSLFPGAVHHFPPLLPSSPFAPLFFFLFSGVCLRAFCWERTLLFGGVWRFPPSSGVGERSGHLSGCFFEVKAGLSWQWRRHCCSHRGLKGYGGAHGDSDDGGAGGGEGNNALVV
ncbi:hypothetical protein BDB00DRAFT_82178 [Zychaea mexicana]|uniref:uncharacterized protein n=1 Tax=Zychaea mexicana TaxID=64656 RepID=UPI0022FE9789|nr:uncharacterized protein BDB00DRAFT_82178 [Zychaea mexicana]KAI9488008.1 hypothetical protein BDB00DRAFT_82178 [Zychaea mexicana]